MLIQADERVLRAIAALKTRPEGQVFFEWLAQSRRQTCDALVDVHEDVALRQTQGAADTLRTITTLVESADALLKPRK